MGGFSTLGGGGIANAGALEDSYIELFKARDARAARLWEYAEILYNAGRLTIDDVAGFINDVLSSIDQIAYDFDKLFSVDFIAKVLDSDNLSADKAASICDSPSISSSKLKAILDTGKLTNADKIAAILDGDSLTANDVATHINSGIYTNDLYASAFDSNYLSADKAASILNSDNLSADKAASILENTNLSLSRMLDILHNMGNTAKREEILRNFTDEGVKRIFEEGLTLEREDKFDSLDSNYWTHNEGSGERTIDTSRYVSASSSLRISRGDFGVSPYHDDVGHDFGSLGDGSVRVYMQEDGEGIDPCGRLVLEDDIHGNLVASITLYPDRVRYNVEGSNIAEETDISADTWYEFGIAVRNSIVFFLRDSQIRYARNLSTYTQFKAVRLSTLGYNTNEFFDDYKAYR